MIVVFKVMLQFSVLYPTNVILSAILLIFIVIIVNYWFINYSTIC